MKYLATIVAAAAFALTACGGGGGGSSPTAATPTPTPVTCTAPQVLQGGVCVTPVVVTPVTTMAGCESDPYTATQDFPTYHYFKEAGYAITTNSWGRDTITNYISCDSAKLLTVGISATFNWDWPFVTPSKVRAYPEILYRPNGSSLQIPITSINNLTVHHDYTIGANGNYQVAYDFWIDPAATGKPHTAEVMIHLQTTWPNSTILEKVTIDGYQYNVFVGPSYNNQWDYISFTATQLMNKADIRLKPFMDYLLSHNYLKSTDYLQTIELGTEVVEGKGTMTLNSFSVSQ